MKTLLANINDKVELFVLIYGVYNKKKTMTGQVIR